MWDEFPEWTNAQQVISAHFVHHVRLTRLLLIWLILHVLHLLTVNGWAGFLSLISQDSRMEFFMAAFTLKLVAKTTKDKNKTNVSMIPVSSNPSTERNIRPYLCIIL